MQNIVGVGGFVLSQGLLGWGSLCARRRLLERHRRRLDLKSEKTSIPIFEGFGSSYEKARSAIVQ